MEEKFIPWPDYAICPKCKDKVDIPKKSWILDVIPNKKPRMETITCPNCKTTIKYTIPSGPPYSIE